MIETRNLKAIVLAAERGIRRLSSADSYPRALLEDPQGRRVMDWILSALEAISIRDITLVGGYHIEKLVAQYPGLNYCYNADWQTSGSLGSLKCAEPIWHDSDCIVVDARYVFHPEAVIDMISADSHVAMAVGDNGAGGAATDFAGVVKLSRRGSADLAASLIESGDVLKEELQDFLRTLDRGARLAVSFRPIASAWAKIDSAANLARFVMGGSKGQTLERLRRVVKSATILDQIRFTIGEWESGQSDVLDRIQQGFASAPVIVRSSAASEDGFSASLAGRFDSVLDIRSDDRSAVEGAIVHVAAGFAANGGSHEDEIFVQPMIKDVRLSGVVFTRDLETGAPYVTVNYDNRSGLSNTVASGIGNFLPTAVVFHDHLERLPQELSLLKETISELIDVTGSDRLDIEFAIDRNDCLYVFQVRPLTVADTMNAYDERDLVGELEAAATFARQNAGHHPLLLGASSLLTDMTDWNPAEIIGTHPRPLALSLYRSLVTDAIWAESRFQCGYRDVRGLPLMRAVAGKPYIDIRTDFNSFIPAAVSDDVALKLVEGFMATLRDDPQLQDKVEFEIVPTCLDFDFERHLPRLAAYGLNEREIVAFRRSLKELTEAIILGQKTPVGELRASIAKMHARRSAILKSAPQGSVAICRTIETLLQDCRQLGTLAFANAARHGFIATALLKSLVARDCLSQVELQQLLATLPTVSSHFTDAFIRASAEESGRPALLEEFGHLRPGTYDIVVPSYAEAPEHYLYDSVIPAVIQNIAVHKDDTEFRKKLGHIEGDISKLLAECGFTFDTSTLIDFIARSIALREWVKFEFTRNLSAVLSLLRNFGGSIGLSVDDISFVPIAEFLRVGYEATDELWLMELRRQSALNRKRYNITSTIRLPPVIAAPEDVFGYVDHMAKPNFVTTKSITAPVAEVGSDNTDNLTGCIVAIERADPGYDWLLTKGIAGLVTKYGGAASHMSIRCAEFGLPAAIGCGEVLFETLKRAGMIHLDCAAKKIERVH